MKTRTTLASLAIYLAYPAIIFSYWFATGADYQNLVAKDVILSTALVPLAIGAVFLGVATSWLDIWRPVLVEGRPGSPRWILWPLLMIVALFIAVNAITTDWSALVPVHLAMLISMALLAGFNEEVLCRGILVHAFRENGQREAAVWFLSSLLFGLMHLPNGLFGPGLLNSAQQVVITFLAGTCYYILRRLSGSLLLPILVHAGWDFSLFAQQASGADPALLARLALSALLMILSISLIGPVLMRDKVQVPGGR